MLTQDSRYLKSRGRDRALPVPLALHPEKVSCYPWIRPKRSPGVDKGAEVDHNNNSSLLWLLSCLSRRRKLQITNANSLQHL